MLPHILFSLKEEEKKKIRLSTEVTNVKRNTVYNSTLARFQRNVKILSN